MHSAVGFVFIIWVRKYLNGFSNRFSNQSDHRGKSRPRLTISGTTNCGCL